MGSNASKDDEKKRIKKTGSQKRQMNSSSDFMKRMDKNMKENFKIINSMIMTEKKNSNSDENISNLSGGEQNSSKNSTINNIEKEPFWQFDLKYDESSLIPFCKEQYLNGSENTIEQNLKILKKRYQKMGSNFSKRSHEFIQKNQNKIDELNDKHFVLKEFIERMFISKKNSLTELVENWSIDFGNKKDTILKSMIFYHTSKIEVFSVLSNNKSIKSVKEIRKKLVKIIKEDNSFLVMPLIKRFNEIISQFKISPFQKTFQYYNNNNNNSETKIQRSKNKISEEGNNNYCFKDNNSNSNLISEINVNIKSKEDNLFFEGDLAEIEGEGILFCFKLILRELNNLIMILIQRILPCIKSKLFGDSTRVYQHILCGQICEDLFFQNQKEKEVFNWIIQQQYSHIKDKPLDLFFGDQTLQLLFVLSQKYQQQIDLPSSVLENNLIRSIMKPGITQQAYDILSNFILNSHILQADIINQQLQPSQELSLLLQQCQMFTKPQQITERKKFIDEVQNKTKDMYLSYFLMMYDELDQCLQQKSFYKKIKLAYKFVVNIQYKFSQCSTNPSAPEEWIIQSDQRYEMIQILIRSYLSFKPHMKQSLFQLALLIELIPITILQLTYLLEMKTFIRWVLNFQKDEEEEEDNDEDEDENNSVQFDKDEDNNIEK